jgi:hypothetical protein
MEDLLNKLSSYEIINNLVPGGLVIFMLNKLGIVSVADTTILTVLLICYVLGVVASRIGSLVLEPIAKHMKRGNNFPASWNNATSAANHQSKVPILEWREYSQYQKAAREYPKIESLQAVSNMYRSLAAAFLLVGAIWIFQSFMPNDFVQDVALIVVGFILFNFAWLKQARYVVGCIDEQTGNTGKKGDGAH